jgi:inorganic pyrophosphatase/exopolyphosphatase
MEKLAEIAGVNLEEYGLEMLKAGTNLASKSAEELIDIDAKTFELNGNQVRVAQVNTVDINEVLDELNPDYKNELIDRYLDEMPEEIVNLMKRYKNINFTKNMYNEYIDKAKNTENGEQIENNNENVRQENVEEAV